MSRMENCVLQNATGKDIVRLTREEADSMVSQGKAIRIHSHGKKRNGTHRYREVVPIAPSNSVASMATLNASDTRAVAGLTKPTIDQAERLHGWGFHIEKAFCGPCKAFVCVPHNACV